MTLAPLLDEFRPGRTIFIPGASGEITALHALLAAHPERLSDVHLICPMVPGMNRFDYAALHPEARLTTFLMPPVMRPSFEAGRVRVVPAAYSAIARYLAAIDIHVALLHLAPGQGDRVSFGVAADFGPIVAERAARRVGVINAAMPAPANAPAVSRSAVNVEVEMHQPLTIAVDEAPSAVSTVIARLVAAMIPDGATIQIGIGAVPGAIWAALHQHRGLRLLSGMVADSFLAAREAGCTTDAGHVAGIAYGRQALYDALDGASFIRFADVRETHGSLLSGVESFHAINSAIEVDLMGQANLEWQNGRLVSGVGGAPDFARAAEASRGGRSILALPATARGGSVSRIVARLSCPASLGRGEVDTVVTEYGVADLRGRSIVERASALISIAAPDVRERLGRDWHAVRATL